MKKSIFRMTAVFLAILFFSQTLPMAIFAAETRKDASAANPAISSSASYSANGNYMTSMTDSRGGTTNYVYNTDRGYVTSVTDALNQTTNYTYTAGEQLSSVSAGNSTVSYSYNTAKQLTGITTPNGSVYGLSYDAFGRKSAVTVGNTTLSSYTYNSLGQTASVTYGNGAVLQYNYDELGRVSETFINNVPQSRYVYDGSSRIGELYDLVGNRKAVYEYDLLGREVKKSIFDTVTGERLACVRTRYDDAKNRISGYEVEAEGKSTSYEYLYGENGVAPDAVTGVKTGGSRLVDRTYDALGRLSGSTLHATTDVTTQYNYLPGASGAQTTTLVGSVVQDGVTTTYTYDANGNITSMTETDGNTSVTTSFTYDAKNQLTKVEKGNDTWEYGYDANGNITSVTKNNVSQASYAYGDTNWKDKLTSFNNANITYDAIGNALTWRDGMTFTWANGRKLASVTQNNATTSFTYDGEGNRIRKVGANGTVEYTVLGGTILGEKRTVGNTVTTLHYLFDESGTRIGFLYNDTPYYYRLNLQGDVTGIYNAAGTVVVEYAYDVWGKLLSVTGSDTTLGNLNPIRYRGYYYDTETELYYLNSRYYDPEVCRFISADGYLSTGQGILGHNMYAYCGNNPVNRCDPDGKGFLTALVLAVAIAACMVLSGCSSQSASAPSTPTSSTQVHTTTRPPATSVPATTVTPALPEIKVSKSKTQVEKKEFVDAVYARGKADEAKTGIPAALMTAQACLESGYGTSSMAVNKNNIFGFVGYSFDSIDHAITSYQDTLTKNARYKHLQGGSLSDWVNGIGPAGYCPEGDYASKLWAIIYTWDLQ